MARSLYPHKNVSQAYRGCTKNRFLNELHACGREKNNIKTSINDKVITSVQPRCLDFMTQTYLSASHLLCKYDTILVIFVALTEECL